MNLDEYIKSDDNDFWKLSPGEMQVLLDESVERIEDLEKVLADWLDCFDTPEEWMRCRNNAKLALGREATPKAYSWTDNAQADTSK